MKVFAATAVAVLAAINMLAVSAAAPCVTAAQLEANRKAAIALLDDMFNKKDISAVDRYIGTKYLQHNPSVPDGPDSLKEYAKTFTNETNVEFGATVAFGDLVWLNTRYSGVPGEGVSITVDVMRFEEGKIVEHWDI